MRAEGIRFITAAASLPALSDPANSQFDRPNVIGRIWFSTQLLPMGSSPSSRKRVSAVRRFRL